MSDDPQAARRLQRQLTAFLAQARQNEQKLHRFQQQEMAFITADGLGDLLDVLFDDYPRRFDLDAVSLRLADPEYEIRRILEELDRLPDNRLQFPDTPLPTDTRPRLGPLSATQVRDHFPGHDTIASAALLPLHRQQRCLGLLAIGSHRRERFASGAATDFLERLAAVLAVCIENALNHERVRRLGLLDPLTGLHNRRYFAARLPEEVSQARRSGAPLCALYLDIDHFKAINDTHGHARGDEVLQWIAQTLKSQMRRNDVLARLGGEEFGILLADTEPATAMDIGERIRLAIAHGSRDCLPFPVTVSLGCSSLDSHDRNDDPEILGEALLTAADEGLYAAKHGGRNQVVFRKMGKEENA